MAKRKSKPSPNKDDDTSGDNMSGASTREPSGDVGDYDELANDPALDGVGLEDLEEPDPKGDYQEDADAMANDQDPWMLRFVKPRLEGRANPYLLAFRA